jgi:hypothetical protein
MPRVSVEAKSAALFRAGAAHRPPPRRLCAAAKALWREIIGDRPVDYFRPGSFEALEQFCEFTIEQRRAIRSLKAASAEDYPARLRVTRDLTSMLAVLARQLRLSVQAGSRYDAGKTDEKGDAPTPRSRLLGGSAVWPQ